MKRFMKFVAVTQAALVVLAGAVGQGRADEDPGEIARWQRDGRKYMRSGPAAGNSVSRRDGQRPSEPVGIAGLLGLADLTDRAQGAAPKSRVPSRQASREVPSNRLRSDSRSEPRSESRSEQRFDARSAARSDDGRPVRQASHRMMQEGPMFEEHEVIESPEMIVDDPSCDMGCDVVVSPIGSRFWVGAEYLNWSTKDADLPPLITSSPAGTSQLLAGRLDQSSTSVLVGGNDLGPGDQSGYRLTMGYGFTPCVGIEVNYFELGEATANRQLTSDGTPILARPFFNTSTGVEDAALIAFPNISTGSFQVQYTSQMHGGEVLFRRAIQQGCVSRWDFLFGYRTAGLDESLTIRDDIVGGNLSAAPGARITQTDLFQVENEFHGADFGVQGQWRSGCWTFGGLMKVAVGTTQSTVIINGNTVITDVAGATASGPGGVLAQPSNIGQYSASEFSVLPELGLNMGYDLSCRARITVGYTLLYWSSVGRPGDQIDLSINERQFFPGQTPIGAQQPQFDFASSSFWTHGLSVGLDYRF